MRSFPLPAVALVVTAAFACVSCASREEKADAAFADLVEAVDALRDGMASVTGAESAAGGADVLAAACDDFWDALDRIDELGEDPELPQDARARLGEKYHGPLTRSVEAAWGQGMRLYTHRFYRSKELDRLYRHQVTRYQAKGRHPWLRAVLAGREYKPAPPKSGRKGT